MYIASESGVAVIAMKRLSAIPRRVLRRAFGCALVLASYAHAGRASADDAPQALVICAQCVTDADAAIEDALRGTLRDTRRFEVMPAAALDLEAVQLAIDCPEQSARCLREAARRLKAELLWVPALSRRDGHARLKVLYFDARSGAEPRSAEREHARDAKGATDFRSELPAMVRELLSSAERDEKAAAVVPKPEGAEPAESQRSAADEGGVHGDDADEVSGQSPAKAVTSPSPSEAGQPLPWGPILLGGGGVVVVAAGLISFAMMSATEDAYARRVVDSRRQAELAEEERSRGKTQAVVTSVLLGTGLTAIAAAGVWLALELRADDDDAHAALTPLLTTHSAGVVLSMPWEPSP